MVRASLDKSTHPNATYTHTDFRRDVLAVLNKRFAGDIEQGTKAVKIRPRHSRRSADVLIATQHRTYRRYVAVGNEDYVTGISFHESDGTRIANYPEQHRANLVAKNQATNEWFKHLIRIFKNARQRLITDGTLAEGAAPAVYVFLATISRNASPMAADAVVVEARSHYCPVALTPVCTHAVLVGDSTPLERTHRL